jgi:hypothetical protein
VRAPRSAIIYHKPHTIVNRVQHPSTGLRGAPHRAGAREGVMIEDDEENGTDTYDAAEDFSDDLEVQIYEAILAREKTGDSFSGQKRRRFQGDGCDCRMP